MHINIGKYIIVIGLLIATNLFGQQELARYPIRFSQYYNSFAMINPAAGGSYSDVELAMGNQRLLGNFSKVSTYYLNANMRLGQNTYSSQRPFSSVGLLVYNDKEGKYLNRSRFYATYVWHANISKSVMISGGFHVGGMNYSVKGTALSGDGSDFVPDGVVGIRVYNEVFHLGVSYSQIFNNEIQPLEEAAKLSPFTSFTGGLTLYLHPSISVHPVYSLQVPINGDKVLIDATLIGQYKSVFRLAFGIHNNNRFVSSVEFRNVFDIEKGVNLAISYSFPLVNSGVNTNFIEMGASYRFNKP